MRGVCLHYTTPQKICQVFPRTASKTAISRHTGAVFRKKTPPTEVGGEKLSDCSEAQQFNRNAIFYVTWSILIDILHKRFRCLHSCYIQAHLCIYKKVRRQISATCTGYHFSRQSGLLGDLVSSLPLNSSSNCSRVPVLIKSFWQTKRFSLLFTTM